MPRLPHPAAALLTLSLASLSPLAATPANAAEAPAEFDAAALQAIANSVAADLMRGIKDLAGDRKLKLAVQPFRPGAVVEADAVARLNDAIERALKDAGRNTITLVDRSNLADAWREAQEFQADPKLEQQVRDANAEILVLGRLSAAPGGYELSYKADDLRTGSTASVVGVLREAHTLPPSFGATPCLRLDDAIRAAASDTADAVATGLAPAGRKPDPKAVGETTRFGNYVADHFIEDLSQLLPDAIRRHKGMVAHTGAAPAPAPPVPMAVRLSVSELRECVDVRFIGELAPPGTNTSVIKRISLASIAAENLLPLEPRCGTHEHTAAGEAWVGKLLDHDGAMRAARVLARARAIAEETCAVFNGPSEVRDDVDATWAMKGIIGGLTTHERWTETDLDGGARVRSELSTTVQKLSGGAPAVTAKLSTATVLSGLPFDIALTADAPAVVAIFAWQSDDRVLRLYPIDREPAPRLLPGRPLTLPRAGEEKFSDEPRPGLTTDFDAFIIVASAKPLDYAKLAEPVAPTVEESMRRARPVGELFEALANLQTPLTIAVLPYQIVPKP